MICADTSSVVAFIQAEGGEDVRLVDRALADHSLALAPISVAELFSNPDRTSEFERFVRGIPQLAVTQGYWERAGKLRASLMSHGFRPKLADSLIAQLCLDHDVSLITRDRDFAAFQKIAGLHLLLAETRLQ